MAFQHILWNKKLQSTSALIEYIGVKEWKKNSAKLCR